jgi:hypothetical protein
VTSQARAVRRFAQFLVSAGVDPHSDIHLAADLGKTLSFLYSRFNSGLQAATVLAEAAALDNARADAGLVRFWTERAHARFRRAVRRARPAASKYLGVGPFAPLSLVPHLLPYGTFYALRERVLFAGRVETLARAGSFNTIRRSTVQSTRDLLDRPVVTFNYSSKGSTALGLAVDCNYVSHLAADIDACDTTLCPAHLMLELKGLIDAMPSASAHDRLLTDQHGAPLTTATVANVITRLMRRAGLATVFTSHSLRGASSQTLQVLGVPSNDVCIRAGWHTSSQSATRSFHYLHGRFVRHNFAQLLLLPGSDIHTTDQTSPTHNML